MSRADAGDEIFFYHKGQPLTGRVICAGKTGCTVEHDGKQHRLKWHHVAGLKKRAPQSYRVLEHGEDGVIVEDRHGRRRYLGIPPESRSERPKLTKQQIHGVHK